MSKAPYLPTIPMWRMMQREAMGQGMTCVCREAGIGREGHCECTATYRPLRIGPELSAAGWAVDAAQLDNDGVTPADLEWSPERLDWRGRWRDELAATPELAWHIEHDGPEAVYTMARLSEGEREAIRMHHEGYSEFDVALAKIGLEWDSPEVVRWRMVGASEREVALRLNVPFGTVRKQLQRARHKLRKLAGVVDRASKDCQAAEGISSRIFFSASVHRQDGGTATSSHTPEAA